MIKKLIIAGMSFLCMFLVACQQNRETQTELESKKEVITLTWYINFSWFDKVWGEDEVSKYITEQTGIHVEYVVPTGDESQHLQSFLARGITTDLITFESWDSTYADFLNDHAFAPLDLLAEEYEVEFMELVNEDTVHWYEYQDHLYVYPNASYSLEQKQSYSNQTFLVRKDLYEAIGSPDMSTTEGFLQALDDAREYSLEKAEVVIPLGLQEFTQTGNISLEEYLQNFLAIPYEENGKVVDRFTHPEYLQWLETFNEANRRGLLAQEIFFDKRVQMEEKIAQGSYFAMLYQWSDCTEQLMELYEQSPEKIYIAVDGPKNSKGEDHTLAGSSIQGWTITGISNGSEQKEAAIQLMTFLMSEEGQQLIFQGLENGTNEEKYSSTDVLWPLMNNAYAEKMGYLLEDESYIREIKDWTNLYTHNFSLYAYSELAYDLSVYAIEKEDQMRRGTLLVDLLLAETEEIFMQSWEVFLEEREESEYYLVIEEKQKQLEENKERLQ